MKCPNTCGECESYNEAKDPLDKKYGFNFCTRTNEPTHSFSNPIDRPVPRPTQCPYNPIR